MKLVMTLVVRDEADILDAQLAFHLNTGVDFVLAIDYRSQGETTAILQAYERGGHLRLLSEPGEQLWHAEWMTRLARLAATEHAADWVFCSDADEFWLSPYGSLKELLAAVPRRYGLVRGVWRHFAPRPDDGGFFAERMTVRTLPVDRPGSPFPPQVKVAHRAHPSATIHGGNHDADVPGLVPLRGWYPIEVLHFPIRNPEQCARKYRSWSQATDLDPAAPSRPIVERGVTGADALFEPVAVDGDALARGIADGSLAVDTRVRDALRLWRRTDGVRPGFLLGEQAPRLPAPVLAPGDEAAALARDVAMLADRDASGKVSLRVDALEQRVGFLERSLSRRAWARLTGRRGERRILVH